MATENALSAPAEQPAEQPAPPNQPSAPVDQPSSRRTVTLPVLPLAIIGAVIVAVLFFGGGVALGYAIADHHGRGGSFQPYGGFHPGTQGGQGGQGGQNGFGQNGGQHPHGHPTTAPHNG